MKVRKRNQVLVDYKEEIISNAIRKAMSETLTGVDEKLATEVAGEVTNILRQKKEEVISVDDIQDCVEDQLMQKRRDVAKQYIVYRYERDQERKRETIEGAEKSEDSSQPKLSDDFIAKVKHLPNPMGCLLYTSDAADEEDSVDLGGGRIIKKKKKNASA